ncbi:hypothetical protein BDY21DRAFT_365199 [Lineolata rhizophorae]|uniref:DUF1295 domain protein n=1 Tax=Lineolata rhizophorae TaxID=578093 RepID=A0A6A6NW35_9PEZI|nr:hypothetical protein BDY21DRAFT_365199 [Lineolata rhizophorae]
MVVPAIGVVIPHLKTLRDCTSFTRTVLPYLPQLKALPQLIAVSYTDLDGLKTLYLSVNPVITALAFALALAPLFLLLSELNRNYSQVDRAWSLLPPVYLGHYCLWAHMSGLPTQRLDNLLAFSCVWGVRLTYNYWRKGGYQIGSEDYRWAVLREHLNGPLLFLFNLVFISFIQSLLLFAITSPAYVLMLASRISPEMNTPDLIFVRTLMGLVLAEWFADEQQWKYQQAKKVYQGTAKVPPKYTQEDLDRGFVVTGLWSLCRHPNFAAEQAIWILVYQWSCFITDVYWNWTLVGAISYVLLFQGSTWLTESISAKKYPEYKTYQKLVNKFIPNLLGAPPGMEDKLQQSGTSRAQNQRDE